MMNLASIFIITTLLIVHLHYSSSDPVLSPETITDEYQNFANAESDITWSDLEEDEYVETEKYDEGNGDAFVKMKDNFLKTLQPKLLDADLVADVAQGEISYADAGQKAGVFLIGFGFCLVVGLLYLLCCPVISCCFCCCRCCGNCGGKKLQKNPSNCKCICMTVFLDIFIATIFVGGIMLITMDDRIGYAIDYLDEALNNNLDDIGRFLNNTADEVDQVSLGGFNFTKRVIARDLENIDYTLGLPIRDYFGITLGVYAMFDSMIAMDTGIDDTIVQMNYVEANQTAWETEHGELDTALSSWRSTYQGANYLGAADCTSYAPCDYLNGNSTFVDTLADPTLFPDLSLTISTLEDTQSNNNLTQSVNEGRRDFDNIPAQLKNDSTGQVSDILSDIDSFYSDINDNIGDIANLTQNGEALENLKDSVSNFFDTLKDYEGYRSAGFIGAAVFIFFITSFWLFGALLGACCYKKHRKPTDRNCCSNCAGILLMSGAGIALVFSFLFMFLTFLLFLFGYPMHKFLCEPLTDPEYTVFKRLIDEPGSLLSDDGYFMGELVFNNGTINLTVSGVLEECRKNEPAFQAFQLENLIDLEQITNWEDSMNITESLGDISTDVSNIEIMTQETEDTLIEMRDALSPLNYSAMLIVLSTDVTQTDLSQFESDLRTVAENYAVSNPTLWSNLIDAANALAAIISNEYADSEAAQSAEYDSVVVLDNIAGDIPDDIDTLIEDANTVEFNMTTSGDDFVAEQVADFAERVIDVVDSYVTYVVDQFMSQMARCKPIWNIWDAVIVTGLCDMTIGTLNGIWFALGWCNAVMFFATVVAIKLSKFFRQMKHDEDEEDEDKDDEDNQEMDEFSPPPKSDYGPGATASPFNSPASPPPPYPGQTSKDFSKGNGF